jgi:hypothetical protein
MPAKARKRAGRRPYKPSEPMRETVMTLAAASLTLPEIAAVLEISRSALCEHYQLELATGRLRRRVETIEQLRKAARGGNVSAMRTLLDLFGSPAQGARLGAKAQRDIAAANAGAQTEWDTLEHGNDLATAPLAIRADNGAATDWGSDLDLPTQ